jgi:hypothetical protein
MNGLGTNMPRSLGAIFDYALSYACAGCIGATNAWFLAGSEAGLGYALAVTLGSSLGVFAVAFFIGGICMDKCHRDKEMEGKKG